MSVQSFSPATTLAPSASPGVSGIFERAAGYWLLVLIPASAALLHFLHLQLVDLEWMYFTSFRYGHDEQTAAMLASRSASKPPMWHFGKNALWPIILLFCETLAVATLSMILAQLSGATAKLRHFFLAGLWSKATFLLTALLVYIRLLVSDSPVRILSKDLDLLSWNSILGLEGDRPLQFLTSNQGPVVLLSIAILAFAYRRLTGRSWALSCLFGMIPYGLWLAGQYYLFAVVFK